MQAGVTQVRQGHPPAARPDHQPLAEFKWLNRFNSIYHLDRYWPVMPNKLLNEAPNKSDSGLKLSGFS